MWYLKLEKNIYFSTYVPPTLTDTHVPSLYQCVETRSTEIFWLLSEPLHHLVGSTFESPSCEPRYATNISHQKNEPFLYEYPLHWVILPTKTHYTTVFFGITLIKHGRRSFYEPLNMSMRVCYLDYMKLDCAAAQWYRQKTYYVNYSCFTSICEQFTDSPS
jgi:hypothetical protein